MSDDESRSEKGYASSNASARLYADPAPDEDNVEKMSQRMSEDRKQLSPCIKEIEAPLRRLQETIDEIYEKIELRSFRAPHLEYFSFADWHQDRVDGKVGTCTAPNWSFVGERAHKVAENEEVSDGNNSDAENIPPRWPLLLKHLSRYNGRALHAQNEEKDVANEKSATLDCFIAKMEALLASKDQSSTAPSDDDVMAQVGHVQKKLTEMKEVIEDVNTMAHTTLDELSALKKTVEMLFQHSVMNHYESTDYIVTMHARWEGFKLLELQAVVSTGICETVEVSRYIFFGTTGVRLTHRQCSNFNISKYMQEVNNEAIADLKKWPGDPLLHEAYASSCLQPTTRKPLECNCLALLNNPNVPHDKGIRCATLRLAQDLLMQILLRVEDKPFQNIRSINLASLSKFTDQ